MNLTLTSVLLIFVTGFIIFRGSSVRVALGAGVLLGALLADGWLEPVVHTLDGVFHSFV